MSDIITGTDFVVIPTQDFDRARAFYRDTLGLEESVQWGNMPGIEFETGSLTLAVMQSDAFGMTFAANTAGAIALQVDDYETARAELESRGVTFNTDTIDSGVCYQAYFSDPDGNALGIHQRYDPRT
ncbi:MAG: hypothetical protein QOI80_2919 [Solirubrobacteraceae bacterium]|jgi:catechol 2,3-dioxygenase-like lactoylglutathione lyase family enzyme|nr:hypothetical protein [Solirubrobacteraceae bacterium]